MLLSGECEILGLEGGTDFVVRDPELISVVGHPSQETIREAVSRERVDLLAFPGNRDHVTAALPGWTGARDVAPARRQSYASRGCGRLRAVACGIGDKHYRRSTPGVAFGTRARRRGVARCRCPGRRTPGGVLLCGFAHGGVVGYRDRYACRTPATRSRCTSYMIEHMKPLRPVWGAEETNAASLGLAARLGFVPVDELIVFHPPRN